MTSGPARPAGKGAGPTRLQVNGTVLTVRRVDAYYAMTVVAPGIAARFRPGQFVAVAVGGPETSMLLRRAFSIHGVRPDHGSTVDFLLGAASADRVCGALSARRGGRTATITTKDGSMGVRGLVTDVLGQVIHECRTDV